MYLYSITYESDPNATISKQFWYDRPGLRSVKKVHYQTLLGVVELTP